MTLAHLAATIFSCVVLTSNPEACLKTHIDDQPEVADVASGPVFTGQSLDVILTAQAALVWDGETGKVLYERNSQVRRPVASLVKLASVLVVRKSLPLSQMVEIPREVLLAQQRGANILLPAGQHATVDDLLGASLTASANDAMVTLAHAVAGSEEEFVQAVNRQLPEFAVRDTRLSTATGLSGGEQYSTAADIRTLLTLLIGDPPMRAYLSAQVGVLATSEGARRSYKTTNKLFGTYLPVVAAKTGYTVEAGQNLAMLTRTSSGHEIGAVVLGSDERFQDMKILVEWINRNYSWR